MHDTESSGTATARAVHDAEAALTARYDRKALIARVREQYCLEWDGLHGAHHWARVRYHGLAVARARDADALVVELFAFLHDSCRVADIGDPHHGRRGAAFAASLNRQVFDLDARQLDRLTFAIEQHSDGHVQTDATIQSCWDADRLDLGRAGIRPAARFLSDEATQRIERGWTMSRVVPRRAVERS